MGSYRPTPRLAKSEAARASLQSGPPPEGFGRQGGRLRNRVFSHLQTVSAHQAAEPRVIV